MKVNQSQSPTTSPVQTSEAKGAQKARAAGHDSKVTRHAEPRDPEAIKADLSERSREMAAARAAATDAPDVREDKVAALKARIAAGTYDVDSKAVADRLVDEHIRMSGIG